MENQLQYRFNLSDYKRKLKSLTEKILLLDVELIWKEDNISNISCKILSSSNKIYNLKIWRECDYVKCKCECLDFTMRNVNCKHIYWFGFNKFKSMSPSEWNSIDYDFFITKHWVLSYNNGRNDSCPICFEHIDYTKETTIYCRYQCRNSVHSNCWNKYYNITGKTECVVCRTCTLPYLTIDTQDP